MINLSPFTLEYTWEAAKSQALRLLTKPLDITALLQLVKSMQVEHAEILRCLKTELEALVSCVACHNSSSSPTSKTVDCAAALYYLANPYDGTFDFFRGIGLIDDLRVIRDVIAKHFAP